jgi:hypothetical protein
MALEDMKKTSLITKTGLYDWTVMPFGLKNATSTFTRTMSEVFKELGSRFLKVFVDDLNVHSENWGEHLQHLEAVLCKLREVNLKLNPSKCCFAAKTITFLGHMVSKEGIRPDPGKVEAVLHFPTPKNVPSVRSFLGLTGYYRKYIRGYSNLAGPLFELTKKDVAFVWDVGCEQAYHALKAALVDAPVLTWPDFKRTFWLDVDWSTKGVGAILSQKEGKFEKVIAYASKNLTEAQRKFHPMEGECYALIWGVMHFRQYLHMKHFILRTDHKPLEWLATVSDAHGRQGRWVGMLQDFSFKIVHRPRFKHMNVDALSRNPIGSATDDDGFGEELQDVAGPEANVPEGETRTGNKYILVAIDHYSKWCEAKAVADHGAKTAARFLEDDVICRYGVPEFVLTDNGGEWAAEFDAMCKDYGIHHQHTTPQWPQCNGMAERLIKMIKQGITILSATPENANCWDEQLAKVLFGYRCGIQASTKFYDSDWADTTPEG